MAIKRIPLLKPGTFTTVSGDQFVVTPEKIDKVVESTIAFNYQNDEFPIVIGHPKMDSPAWGWGNKKNVGKDEDGILYADVDEDKLVPEFQEAVKKGLYKTVSVKLRPDDLSIWHIGFLGAKPPAVAGLPTVQLSENDKSIEVDIELAEFQVSQFQARSIGQLARAMREFIIAKFGKKDADETIPNYLIDEVSSPPRVREVSTSLQEFENTEINLNEGNIMTPEQIAALKADNAKLKTDLEAATTGKKTAETKFTDLQIQQKRNDVIAFCEGDDVKNKIKDGEKDALVEVLLLADQEEAIELGEGVDKKTHKPVDVIKNLIKSQPDVVELGEFSKKTDADTNEDKSKAIKVGESIAAAVNPAEKK